MEGELQHASHYVMSMGNVFGCLRIFSADTAIPGK
jgi:hypothetical protein